MIADPPLQMERNIARSRLVLSLGALLAVYVDPTLSAFSPWSPTQPGWFSIDPYALAILGVHLTYSLAIYVAVSRGRIDRQRLGSVTTWADVGLGALIALFTEGASSPFYAFFVFGVVEVGLRAGFRQTLLVTAVSVLLYLSLILVSAPQDLNFYIMRPVYLAITGYLVGYIGQQRLNLEQRMELLAATDQRTRIGRDLHDGYAQSLAGVSLRIERCRELVRRGRGDRLEAELTELQAAVNHEFDSVRAYSRALAGMESAGDDAGLHAPADPMCSVRVDLTAPAGLVDQILQILREGVMNVRRHANAAAASVQVSGVDRDIVVRIADDGVGFAAGVEPWSIRSRVRELGGRLDVGGSVGGLLTITLPRI